MVGSATLSLLACPAESGPSFPSEREKKEEKKIVSPNKNKTKQNFHNGLHGNVAFERCPVRDSNRSDLQMQKYLSTDTNSWFDGQYAVHYSIEKRVRA